METYLQYGLYYLLQFDGYHSSASCKHDDTRVRSGLEGDSPGIAENGYSLMPSTSQATSWVFQGWNTKRYSTGDWYCPSSMKTGECATVKTAYQDLPALSTGLVTLYAQWSPATPMATTPLHDLPETGSRDLIQDLQVIIDDQDYLLGL